MYGTWVPMLQAMKDEYPDVKDGVRTFDQQGFLTIDDQQFAEQVTFADPSLFSIFHLPLEHGDGVKLLQNKYAVILSRETASRFFGDEDAIGKPIRLMMNGMLFDLTVAAVMEPVPANSSIRPEIVISFENAMDIAWVRDAGWDDAWLMTYIQTNTPSDAAKLETLFPAFVKKFYDEETASRMKFKLMPLRDFHDALTHSRRAAYVMICIAFIIVLIAVVNYINLTTVRSIERAKEIGLRKALGASKGSLIRQFLSESLVLTSVAFVGACILLQASLPFVNQLLETTIDVKVRYNAPRAVNVIGCIPSGRTFFRKLSRFFHFKVQDHRIDQGEIKKYSHRSTPERCAHRFTILAVGGIVFLNTGHLPSGKIYEDPRPWTK